LRTDSGLIFKITINSFFYLIIKSFELLYNIVHTYLNDLFYKKEINMSKIRAIVLALLVSMFAFFAGCDDDDTVEEETPAGQEVECVVSEEETCEEETPAGEEVEAGEEPVVEMDMEMPVEAGEMPDEMDMEMPVEAGEEVDPMPEAGAEEASEGGTQESTEEAPVEETPAGEEGEPVDPAPQAGEPG
jgi:hypothetical protein